MKKPASFETLLRDENGFSTPAVAVALLLTLSLIFTTAQVYRIQSASAGIQDIADAAALAAENEVAEFIIVVRVCDAIVLSLSLTGTLAVGLGVAALCTPVTAPAAESLLAIGEKVFKARDSFSETAIETLKTVQKALPFLAAANAASVAAANNGGQSGSEYLAIAFLVPETGSEIGLTDNVDASEVMENIDAEREDLTSASERAEEAAQRANEAKQRAFERDCGDNPNYCMYERAATLAGLSASDNPLYHSVETWSFAVALKRAQAYYASRLSIEAPEGTSVEELARSALRERFYRYAVDELSHGYVHDDGDTFDAYFPRLPRNTAEMRETSLYTEAVYPVSGEGDALTMHAWDGCPGIAGAVSLGSIADMEASGYETCASCGFSAASLGRVAAASTSIENGFEYHYDAVAREAEIYEQARNELAPAAQEVKELAGGLIDQCGELASRASTTRIQAQPPGSYGAIALVVDTAAMPASAGFESSFVETGSTLGVRAAVSGATLLDDPAEGGESVISSLLDSVAEQGGAAVGVAGALLDAWSALLYAYTKGQEAISSAFEKASSSISLNSESGLGVWAAQTFSSVLEAIGLEPADIDAPKPVIVSTAHVAGADSQGTFSSRFLTARQTALSLPGSTSDVLSSVVSDIERAAFDDLASLGGTIEIATIEPFGTSGPSIPITIALPQAVESAASGFVDQAIDFLRSLVATTTGVKTWG